MHNYLFSLLAGLLTALSPCVLPLLPIVLGGAATRSRWVPAVMVAGLVLTSAAFGFLVASVGRGIGMDADLIRRGSGLLLILVGATLLLPGLQARLTAIVAPVSGWASAAATRTEAGGLAMQFAAGALTGLVWSPCAGPTLGAAIGFAMQADTQVRAAVTMLMFSIGAGLPMLALAYGTRAAIGFRKARLSGIARVLKPLASVAFILVGSLTMSGLDHRLESALVELSPSWLTDVTTKF